MKNRNIDLIDLDESVTARFMKRMIDASRDRVQRARPTLRQFLAYLRVEAVVCPPTLGRLSAIAHIYGRYLDYLRQDRGLTKNSLLVYGPFIRDFLDSHSAGDGSLLPDAFDAATIRDHFLAYSKGRSAEYTRLMAVALRSFCHLLFLRGHTARDLYESVPTVRKWQQSAVPTFLTPEQQEALIATADRSTPTGRRDYAILLLLARLGLRAGEIVAIELDDIHWRSGELVVHGKGQMVEHVPLPSEIGEAIATYLRDGRGSSASRRVFLRRLAPRLVSQFDMRASMSRRGNCYDNAPIESFWGTLKNELVYHQRFATREQARLAISEYIEIFYNRQRTQARLNYQSPVAFTQRFYLNQIAA
ncbi:IS3 family transposase [Burkholderia ubonensis]|uniref:IS3 family transposase n=1 Tax=Burkholderia ubonensis TaxID=101571 RepID=UPI000A7AA7C5|nr:IS3 family transposase [Burkholderia ubonensis]